MSAVCEWSWLGTVEYQDAWQLQRDLALKRSHGEIPDTMLLLEHAPVYTTGRRDASSNLRMPAEQLGAPVVETDRGGDITFHGPGQLVAYPIVDLKAARLGPADYVRGLEEVIILTLAGYGIEAGVICGLTGAWVGDEKIAAIGVRVSRPAGAASGWITTHGLALNVSVDLDWFARVIPCGIADKGVTSMQALLAEAPEVETVADDLATAFGAVVGRRMDRVPARNYPLPAPSSARA